MTGLLDDLQLEYRGMLRHGVLPTGIILRPKDFGLIRSSASRSDRRLQWNEDDEIELLFGFRPVLADDEPSRFTSRSHPRSPGQASCAYTLTELRAL